MDEKIEALLRAAKSMLKNIDHWLETGIPANAEESCKLVEDLRKAVDTAEKHIPRKGSYAEGFRDGEMAAKRKYEADKSEQPK